MADFTQAGRSLKVQTPLGSDVLLLERFEGRELIGGLYEYDLEMLSERNDIDPADVLRKPIRIELELPDGSFRLFNGICNRFSQGATDAMLTSYSATLVPWTWFLQLRQDCRIFQELTPQDIIAEVFDGAGYAGKYEDRSSSRPQRAYCVQYRESDLDFVHRLMEEEGLWYFFEHEGEDHKLILVDAIGSSPPVPAEATVRMTDDRGRREDVVERFELRHTARIGKVTYRDYDHLQPSFTLESSLAGEQGEEVYDYSPGRYVTREGGEVLAQYQLEAEEALREEGFGGGSCRQFAAGYTFTLAEHPNERANQEYLLLEVRHRGSGGDYRSSGQASALDYENTFHCIPTSVPYRPRRITPKPVVRGSQTAVVVGPAGEEIYTDNHGRIKVQFHWDRLGRKDENSSCWIRVAHPWAGKSWGAVAIPRIGQEVVVDFLEGDPDQPLVVGSVYNAEQTPPFALPDNGMVSGIKSNSTPGGGGYNGIELNDTKGTEKFSMHAQYNMDTVVENDQSLVVHNNRTATVDVDETMSVGNNQTLDVGADQKISVAGNQEESVGGNRTDAVSGDEDRSVGGSQTVAIGSDREVNVGANDTVAAGSNMDHSAAANLDLSSGANTTITAGANGAFNASANLDLAANAMVNVTAGAKITLSAGGSTIEIGPDGIKITAAAIVSINGMLVKIN